MGVDVQDNRLAYEVVGWGVGFESWGIEYSEIFGDPRQGDVWTRLDEVLSRSWAYKNGKRLRVIRVAVDTGGHLTPQVLDYCKTRQMRGVYPIKGFGGDKMPLARPSQTKGNREKGLFIVGVDGIKADIISCLKIGKPGAGYCHFPKDKDKNNTPINGYDASYFEMLTAEKRTARKDKKGFTVYAWIKVGTRNESFDCRVYARAALRIMSSKDAQTLERISINEPWAGPETTDTLSDLEEVVAEKVILPKNKRKSTLAEKNKRARERGISYD
jgi:phage terminase large subunit GpA-like protein